MDRITQSILKMAEVTRAAKEKEPVLPRDNLKKARAKSGLTYKDVSELTGISRGSIYALENTTENPRVKEIYTLAKLYGTTVEKLMESSHGDNG